MEQTFVNGKVFVGTSETDFVSAFKVKDGRISWIGQTEQVDDPQAIDLHQQTVLPGLIDCQPPIQIYRGCSSRNGLYAPNVNSIREMIPALKASPQWSRPDVWIEGWGFDETKRQNIARQPLTIWTRLPSSQSLSTVPTVIHRLATQSLGTGRYRSKHPRSKRRPYRTFSRWSSYWLHA